MAATVRAALTAIAGALLPERCVACERPLPPAVLAPVCSECIGRLPPAVPPGAIGCLRCGIQLISESGTCLGCRERPFAFDANMSRFAYRGGTRDLIRAYKFGRRIGLAALFAERIAAQLRTGLVPPFSAIVPAPARPAGIRRRGYDHMQLFAQALWRRHGLPVANVLRRLGGREQKALDYQQRARNLDGCLLVTGQSAKSDSATVPGMQAVVIDDVFTTGATINECTRVLRHAGARSVWSLTLTRD